MTRQFVVAFREPACHVVVNVAAGTPLQTVDYQAAATQAGAVHPTDVAVNVVPAGYEIDLPFDEVPLMLPVAPLPGQRLERCVVCRAEFLTYSRGRIFCTRRCATARHRHGGHWERRDDGRYGFVRGAALLDERVWPHPDLRRASA